MGQVGGLKAGRMLFCIEELAIHAEQIGRLSSRPRITSEEQPRLITSK